MTYTVHLPYPPSVNHYWRRNRNGGMRISDEGKVYRQEVGIACMVVPTHPGRLAVTIDMHAPDNRRRDVDNIAKALLDALEHAGVYENDSQIDDLHIRRREMDRPRGHVSVCISTITE